MRLKTMKCLKGIDIMRWVDGELQNPSIQDHLRICASCKREEAAARQLRDALKNAAFRIEPSLDFERAFWQKVYSVPEPWYRKVLADLEAMLPPRALSPVYAVLLIAILIGGSGGFFTGLYSGTGQDEVSLRYPTGYSEYKGIPASSFAAVYLQSLESSSS